MKSVLVIESNAILRTAIHNLLTLQWPHLAVFTAESGPKGLHIAHEVQPDVILLECELPGLDSYQTAKVLRHLPETQSIPLIALTKSNEDPSQKFIGLQNACQAWLTKPISADKLFETITTVQNGNRLSA